MERKSFSMPIILIDRWQVLAVILDTRACRCRTKLITQWSTSIVAHCFCLDFGSECLQRRKKSLSVFVLDSKTKEDDKIVLQSVGFEISRERQGLLLQSRKMAKRWQSFWKTHWNYREIEFHEFLSERSELFRPRSGQASDKFATGPAPYIKSYEGLFWKSIVVGEQLQEKLKEVVCFRFFQGSVELLENVSSNSWLGSKWKLPVANN